MLPITDKTLLSIALRLNDMGAVRVGEEFVLKSGTKSKVYFNLRMPENAKPGPLDPQTVRDMAIAMYKLANRNALRYDAVCGVPHAGVPFARAFAQVYHEDREETLRVILLAKSGEGAGRRIDRVLDDAGLPNGARVLLIDDLITRATSKIEAIEVLERRWDVNDVLVFLDREQGGEEELAAKLACNLHSVCSGKELMATLLRHERISDAVYSDAIKELMGPANAPA